MLTDKVRELRAHIRTIKDTASVLYTLARERVDHAAGHPQRRAAPGHVLVSKAYDTMNNLHFSLDYTADALLKNAQIIDMAVDLSETGERGRQ